MKPTLRTVLVEDLIDEISMGPFGSNIKTSCFESDGVPVLCGRNLSGYEITDFGLRYVSEEKAQSLGKAVAHRGDIVITHRGTLGQVAVIPKTSKYDRYVISQSEFRVRCNDLVLPEYLVYYFHTPIGQWKLLSNRTQTGVPALGRPTSTFRQLSVEIPDRNTQSRILHLVSPLNEEIRLNQLTNDYLAA